MMWRTSGRRAPMSCSRISATWLGCWRRWTCVMVEAGAGRQDPAPCEPGGPGASHRTLELPFDQPDVAGAWTLSRFFRSELDALALTKQFEHRASYGASVKEMLD